MKTKAEQTDPELLRSMLSGDEESFALLYQRRHGGIYRFALQMCGSQQIAEDVTHDVFVFLMKSGQVFDPARGSVSSFLFGVARNYVLRRFRTDHATVPLIDDDDDTVFDRKIDEPGPLDDLTRLETIEGVRRAVLSLPERYREVVVLCELQSSVTEGRRNSWLCKKGTVRVARISSAVAYRRLRPTEVLPLQ
jgi:RNA polymerase sigma-70 factor (ECF subfamily)